MRARIASLALLAAAAVTSAEEPALRIEVEPKKLDEGRRGTLIVRVVNGGNEAVALAKVELGLGRAKRSTSLVREERGSDLSALGGGVVTLSLRAEEGDLGPVGRGPRAPLLRGLGDDLFKVHCTLAPGESLAFELEVEPLAPRDADLAVDVEAIAIEQLRRVRVLAPLLPVTTRVPGTPEGGDPAAGAGPWPGPPTVEVTARRWEPVPPEAPTPGEVLLSRDEARRLLPLRLRLTQGIELVAGEPASRAALDRAGLVSAEIERAAFVPGEGIWFFDQKDRAWIVPREGKPSSHAQSGLAALGHALAGGGQVSLRVPSAEALLAGLKGAGFEAVPSQEKDRRLQVRCGPGDLPRLLGAIEPLGYAVRGMAIEK